MPGTQGHFENADIFMIAGYFVLMLGIGAYFYNRMKRMKDYFSGGNRIPWWLSGVSFYMSSFSVSAFVFYPGLCYRYGWVGVTLLWVAVPATIFSVMLFAKRWRRARIDSPVEYLEMRYSSFLRQLFAWHGIPVRMVDDGMKLFATATFISVCANVELKTSILAAGGIILIYTFMGGLWAVAVTDFIQFVILGVGVLIILPLSVVKAGGMNTVLTETPEGFFRLTSEEFGWSYVIPVILLYALHWSATNWSLIQRYYCVPRERDAMKVGWLVVVLYIIGPPLMFFPAIAATQFVTGLEDAGHIYPILCTKLLPAGMLGLAIAAMFAATMSTLSSDYNVCAGVLTNDVYRRLIRPDASQKELVLVGRLMTLVIGVLALATAVALASQNKAEDLFRLMITLFAISIPPVSIPMLFGLVSRRFTNLSAVLGCILGLGIGLALFKWAPEEELLFAGIAWKMEIVYLVCTGTVTTAVMLFTSMILPANAVAQARTDEFFRRIEVPIGELPEDLDTSGGSAFSPFRVVGVSVALIGVLMLCVLPWIAGRTESLLAGGIGVLLAAVGGAVAYASRKTANTA